MPSRGQKFILEFLLPSLNGERFGTRLKWVDIDNFIFRLQWNHKSASHWTENDAEVFIEWDKLKGHYKPDDKEYFSKSKQRFRAVMYKLITGGYITELCCEDKYTKIYCFGKGENIPKSFNFPAKDKCSIIEYTKVESAEYPSLFDPEENMDCCAATVIPEAKSYNINEDHGYSFSLEQYCSSESDLCDNSTILLNSKREEPFEEPKDLRTHYEFEHSEESFFGDSSCTYVDQIISKEPANLGEKMIPNEDCFLYQYDSSSSFSLETSSEDLDTDIIPIS